MLADSLFRFFNNDIKNSSLGAYTVDFRTFTLEKLMMWKKVFLGNSVARFFLQKTEKKILFK